MDCFVGEEIGGYLVDKLIGKGGFGCIYSVYDNDSGIQYAMKTEIIECNRSTLAREIALLKTLQGSPMFPRLIKTGENDKVRYLVMELLGNSIAKVKERFPGKKIPFETSIRASMYMLKCIQQLHMRGIIHRDIKPGNFLIRGDNKYPMVLIDFGLACFYVDVESGVHLPARDDRSFAGTAAYASPHSLMGEDISRRDDIYSWFLSMIEMINGKLPWDSIPKNNLVDFRNKISKKQLCNKLPVQIRTIYDMIAKLEFDETPDYTGLIDVLSSTLQLSNACESNHLVLDLLGESYSNPDYSLRKHPSFTNLIEVSCTDSNNSPKNKNVEMNCSRCRVS